VMQNLSRGKGYGPQHPRSTGRPAGSRATPAGQSISGQGGAGCIHCGHDTFLQARLVDDLTVECDDHMGSIRRSHGTSRTSVLKYARAQRKRWAKAKKTA
jgi:hypothetical protein